MNRFDWRSIGGTDQIQSAFRFAEDRSNGDFLLKSQVDRVEILVDDEAKFC